MRGEVKEMCEERELQWQGQEKEGRKDRRRKERQEKEKEKEKESWPVVGNVLYDLQCDTLRTHAHALQLPVAGFACGRAAECGYVVTYCLVRQGVR